MKKFFLLTIFCLACFHLFANDSADKAFEQLYTRMSNLSKDNVVRKDIKNRIIFVDCISGDVNYKKETLKRFANTISGKLKNDKEIGSLLQNSNALIILNCIAGKDSLMPVCFDKRNYVVQQTQEQPDMQFEMLYIGMKNSLLQTLQKNNVAYQGKLTMTKDSARKIIFTNFKLGMPSANLPPGFQQEFDGKKNDLVNQFKSMPMAVEMIKTKHVKFIQNFTTTDSKIFFMVVGENDF